MVTAVRFLGLNRTFYGIEIELTLGECLVNYVLIVPFMELKSLAVRAPHHRKESLNRTFYGIEILS